MSAARPYPLITVSAAYGAGGSVVGPALAETLGVPFHDRAIPVTVAAELGVDLESVVAHDGRAEHGLGRLLSAAARIPNNAFGGMEGFLSDPRQVDAAIVAGRTAELVRAIADDSASNGGGVLLGRAAAVVLERRPGTFHIRLDGPSDARIAQATRLRGLDQETATKRQQDNDAAREAYVRRLFGRDPRDIGLYHLVLDSTACSLEDCVALIAFAAEQRR
jgi:cytidylate kinase